MSARELGSVPAAALLVSASYGIGLLFGSGEMAMAHGMAGSLYGLATALGMFLLALFAGRLWRAGVPVWDLFGAAYGPRLQGGVALLSVVWMAGVLAAQIRGGVAIATLLGLEGWAGSLLVLVLIGLAAHLSLRRAAWCFSLCLLSSTAVLLYALSVSGGWDLVVHAAPHVWRDLYGLLPVRVASVLLMVGLLVCAGADYHQFLLAAKRPSTAVVACVLAGCALMVISVLPPALVVAMRDAGHLGAQFEARQVVPLALAQVAGSVGPGADQALLLALSAAALGSGAAIVRAMGAALASAGPRGLPLPGANATAAALALGALVAARDQGIVDTMVSLNAVYLASVGVGLVALWRGTPLAPRRAAGSMATGLAVSLGVYACGWAGWLGDQADLLSLGAGLAASALAAFVPGRRRQVPEGMS